MTATTERGSPERSLPIHEAVASMRRHALIGYFALMFVFVGPLAVRVAFGVCSPLYFLSTVLAYGPVVAFALAAMVIAFGAALEHGMSLKAAGAASLASTVPVIVVGYCLIALAERNSSWFVVLDPKEPHTATYQVITGVSDSFPFIAAWAGVFQLPVLLRLHDARVRENEGLRRDAELLRLKTHLEPHFLLNTMNTIAGLVTEDPTQARELLVALGDLLRDATSLGDRHAVEDELAWLRRYVSIHAARFPEMFEVTWDVPREVRRGTIPALLLQPLVENAISHGVSRVERGKIVVRGHIDGDAVVFEVRDNGKGPGPRRVGGKGLSIVVRRLELESSEADASKAFSLERDGEWTVARVRLPKKENA